MNLVLDALDRAELADLRDLSAIESRFSAKLEPGEIEVGVSAAWSPAAYRSKLTTEASHENR